jgi:hypothetical protein
MPSFITFDSILNTFVINPANPATDIGMFTVKGLITDTKLSTEFSFKVETFNTPAYMKEKPAE